ncbi:Uncharacterized membrane protein YckC, RDD family [Paramicrobacterium humi]|uniref:Uncharacterized membrane protein YckC, RDD family n=1 Tax=Paramicrobacterium humi TaxID=640635 RepID=A0A1H4JU17_9MICO|nr:RDD family protein [Microbacterium humi]SEB49486.1 Uncharacterized membrane protein YckC, RDD family [Microbacterium humi]
MSVTLEAEEPQPIPGVDSEGRPDPAYAERLGLVPAPPVRRSLAFLIDAAFGLLLLLPALIAFVPFVARFVGEAVTAQAVFGQADILAVIIVTASSWLLYSVYVVVQLALHGRTGYTIGKRVLGIRSVNVARFDRPGFWRIVARAAVLAAANSIVPLVGALVLLCSPAWSARGRGWLDVIGGNWMIDVRHGLDPFDAKALRHARRAVEAEPVAEATRLPSLASGSADSAPFLLATRSRAGVVGAPAGVTPAEGPAPTPPPAVPGSATASVPPVPVPPPLPPSPQPVASAPAPALTALLVLDDGSTHEVRGRGILGRDPSPRQATRVDSVVAVHDESRSLSKTHIDFTVVDGGLAITDRQSTNGTSLRTIDGTVTAVEPGATVTARWNDIVQLGDRWFRVAGSPDPRVES